MEPELRAPLLPGTAAECQNGEQQLRSSDGEAHRGQGAPSGPGGWGADFPFWAFAGHARPWCLYAVQAAMHELAQKRSWAHQVQAAKCSAAAPHCVARTFVVLSGDPAGAGCTHPLTVSYRACPPPAAHGPDTPAAAGEATSPWPLTTALLLGDMFGRCCRAAFGWAGRGRIEGRGNARCIAGCELASTHDVLAGIRCQERCRAACRPGSLDSACRLCPGNWQGGG